MIWPLFSIHAVFLLTLVLLCLFKLSLLVHFVLFFVLNNFWLLLTSLRLPSFNQYQCTLLYVLFLSAISITIFCSFFLVSTPNCLLLPTNLLSLLLLAAVFLYHLVLLLHYFSVGYTTVTIGYFLFLVCFYSSFVVASAICFISVFILNLLSFFILLLHVSDSTPSFTR